MLVMIQITSWLVVAERTLCDSVTITSLRSIQVLACSSSTVAAVCIDQMLSCFAKVLRPCYLHMLYTQVHVLDQTGLADITADVNFAALRRSVASIKGMQLSSITTAVSTCSTSLSSMCTLHRVQARAHKLHTTCKIMYSTVHQAV